MPFPIADANGLSGRLTPWLLRQQATKNPYQRYCAAILLCIKLR